MGTHILEEPKDPTASPLYLEDAGGSFQISMKFAWYYIPEDSTLTLISVETSNLMHRHAHEVCWACQAHPNVSKFGILCLIFLSLYFLSTIQFFISKG
jgi:hypothetical protein